jgi:hypothetical protein
MIVFLLWSMELDGKISMNGRILKDSAMAYWILSINFSEMNEKTTKFSFG